MASLMAGGATRFFPAVPLRDMNKTEVNGVLESLLNNDDMDAGGLRCLLGLIAGVISQ